MCSQMITLHSQVEVVQPQMEAGQTKGVSEHSQAIRHLPNTSEEVELPQIAIGSIALTAKAEKERSCAET